MDTYEMVKKQINDDLRATIIGIMDKKQIPYNLNSDEVADYYTTFFATNCELNLPKKQQSKRRLANPKIDIVYTFRRDFDFSVVSNPAVTESRELLTKLMFIFHDLADPEWQIPITTKLKTWLRTILGNLSIYYEEKYSIKIARLPLEIWVKSPDEIFVSKIPEFDYLTLVSTNGSNISPISNSDFIAKQVEIYNSITDFPFAKKTQ